MVEVVAMFGDDVVDVRHIDDSRAHCGYRVGRSSDADLAVDVDDRELTFPATGHSVVDITPSIRVFIRRVDAAPRIPVKLTVDGELARSMFGSIVFHALLVGLVATTPIAVGGIPRLGMHGMDDHYEVIGSAVRLGGPPSLEHDDHSPDNELEGRGSPSPTSGGAAGGTTGRTSGHMRIPDTNSRSIKLSDKRTDLAESRRQAIEAARYASILDSSSITAPDAFRGVTGAITSDAFGAQASASTRNVRLAAANASDARDPATDPSTSRGRSKTATDARTTAASASGVDASLVYADAYGGDGAMRGNFGMSRGNGVGATCEDGSGNCNGTIGTGRYGTIGNGSAIGDGWGASGGGVGGGQGGMSGRMIAIPTVFLCGRTSSYQGCGVTGGLDKAIVRRYIRRNLGKVQYCFERRLVTTHELEGTVSTEFIIGSDGVVHDSTATGVDDEVSSCVAKVMEGIAFPPNPQRTQVHYPFTFRRS